MTPANALESFVNLQNFILDMNQDGRISLSDVFPWLNWICLFPGKVMLLGVSCLPGGEAFILFIEADKSDIFTYLLSLVFFVLVSIAVGFVCDGKPSKLMNASEQQTLQELRNAPVTLSAEGQHRADALFSNGEFTRAGEAYSRSNHSEEAAKAFLLAAKRNPVRFNAAGDAYIRAGKYDRAMASYLAAHNYRQIVETCFQVDSLALLLQIAQKVPALTRELSKLEPQRLEKLLEVAALIQQTAWIAPLVRTNLNECQTAIVAKFLVSRGDSMADFWRNSDNEGGANLVHFLLQNPKRFPVRDLVILARAAMTGGAYRLAGLLYEEGKCYSLAAKCWALSGYLIRAKFILERTGHEPLIPTIAYLASLCPISRSGKIPIKTRFKLSPQQKTTLTHLLAPISSNSHEFREQNPFFLSHEKTNQAG